MGNVSGNAMRPHVRTFMTCVSGNFVKMGFMGWAGCRIVLCLLAASYAAVLHAAKWEGGVVDSSAGLFSSMKFDSFGNAHVAYLDPTRNQLRYGFWDRTLNKWFTETLGSSGGFCSLVLDSHQHPHISHQRYGGGLMYAHFDGASWQNQRISISAVEIAFYTSIALDKKDRPIISFYETVSADNALLVRLRTVTWNGEYWALTTVDSAKGSGKFNSIAVDSEGSPSVAYANVNFENASLRYAHWTGESWKIEIVDGEEPPGSTCYSVSMILDKNDNPHIVFTDIPHLLVKYATKKNGRWKVEAVDSLVREGYPDRNGIALDDGGNPYVSYYDAGAGVVRVAHREGQKWMTETLDRGFAGLESSLQIDHGFIWITLDNKPAPA